MASHRRCCCRIWLLQAALALAFLAMRSGTTWMLCPADARVPKSSQMSGLRARHGIHRGSRRSIVRPCSQRPSEEFKARRLAAGTLLATVCGAAMVLSGGKEASARIMRKRSDEVGSEVDVYFGVGSFFHLQHLFVMQEAEDLGRRQGDLSAIAGYAGGKNVGNKDNICYTGFWLGVTQPDHAALGHAQVVRLALPVDNLGDFTRTFLDEIPKRKPPFELGPQFRATIGIRGGMDSKYFASIRDACEGRVQLVKGQGDEPDTFESDTVYVYDSKRFRFRQAEVSKQYQDNPPETFDADYKDLGKRNFKLGVVTATPGCAS